MSPAAASDRRSATPRSLLLQWQLFSPRYIYNKHKYMTPPVYSESVPRWWISFGPASALSLNVHKGPVCFWSCVGEPNTSQNRPFMSRFFSCILFSPFILLTSAITRAASGVTSRVAFLFRLSFVFYSSTALLLLLHDDDDDDVLVYIYIYI